MSNSENSQSKWALILGASSGFGEATSLELAKDGYNIFGVHLDRRQTLPNVERILGQLNDLGVQAEFFNINAADEELRERTLDDIQQRLESEGGTVAVMVHSLAFGSIRPFWSTEEDMLTPSQMAMTMDVMASSIVYWAQGVLSRNLMGKGGRIFGLTSAGGTRVWARYGAVSAAKAALEACCRQLAYELAPMGITCNAIRAGVTDTPALRKITGFERIVHFAQEHNPSGRLTTPQDVANAIALLSHPRSQWITGATIDVDGGEYIAD